MRSEAPAKVNLALRVRPPGPDGYHPIRSPALTVDWTDTLTLEGGAVDRFDVVGAAPPGEANLAWRAVLGLRNATGAAGPVHLALEKRIAAAAGLGGGSADAAAALCLAADHYRLAIDLVPLATDLGADVPFCLTGGFALLEGRGERVTSLGPVPEDFALGVVVPPVELSTPAVYGAWDRLDGPEGPAPPLRSLPPSLRSHHPLPNDLYPAAVHLAPELDDWRAELEARWDRPVAMTGSGPSLFGYFLDREEAAAAVDLAPVGARAAQAVVPSAERGP